MDGLMMGRQLLIQRLLWRAEHVFGDKGVIARTDGACTAIPTLSSPFASAS
jgi:hypothetical protein